MFSMLVDIFGGRIQQQIYGLKFRLSLEIVPEHLKLIKEGCKVVFARLILKLKCNIFHIIWSDLLNLE